MPIKIQINITGLAVCYLDGDRWRIDFLCDNNHRLIFKNSSEPGKEESLADNQTIDIDVIDPVTRGSSKNQDPNNHFMHIFNIVADAHTGGVDRVNPTLPGKHKVSMSIQHSKLGKHIFTNRRYGIKRADRPNDQYRPLRRVAKVVSAEVELQNGGQFIFKVNGIPRSIPFQNNTILTFDNDCRNLTHPECQPGDDSQLFYELIRGRENPPVRYKFTTIGEIIERLRGKVNRRFFSHPDGNCDPIVIDPPPDPPS